jgi:hypothetical protein
MPTTEPSAPGPPAGLSPELLTLLRNYAQRAALEPWCELVYSYLHRESARSWRRSSRSMRAR